MTPLRQAAAAPYSSVQYVAPFLTFVVLMGLEKALDVPLRIGYPLRCLATLVVFFRFSRGLISWRLSQPLLSALLGAAVFFVWVGPDVLFGYRGHWLFQNSLVGEAKSSIAPALRSDVLFLTLRVAGSALLIPVLEELFWRAWMMRWLVEREFWKLPLGSASALSFWVVAVLFATEHGPWWEVGLATGILYNWWLIRTRSLADCILAHAVTNAILAFYVIAGGHWQYWL
jgi:uncharacterized protein